LGWNEDGGLSGVKAALPSDRDSGKKNRDEQKRQDRATVPINDVPVFAQVRGLFFFGQGQSLLIWGRKRNLRSHVLHKFVL
jgi:hypothetical protein